MPSPRCSPKSKGSRTSRRRHFSPSSRGARRGDGLRPRDDVLGRRRLSIPASRGRAAQRWTHGALRRPLVEVYLGPGLVSPATLPAEFIRPFSAEITAARRDVSLASITILQGWLGAASLRIGLWPEWFAGAEPHWPSS